MTINDMLANYTANGDLNFTDQALLFGLTTRIKYNDDNVDQTQGLN